MFALCTPNIRDLLQREHYTIFFTKVTNPLVDLSVADIRWQIATEWLEIAQWSQWGAYKKPLSFTMTPYTTSPSLKIGVPNAPLMICRISNGRICATAHPIHFVLRSGIGFSNGAISGSIKFSMAGGRYLGKLQRYRAVSFATARVSCY